MACSEDSSDLVIIHLTGLFPGKRVLAVGSDADLTILNTNLPKKLTRADFHVADYNRRLDPGRDWQYCAHVAWSRHCERPSASAALRC